MTDKRLLPEGFEDLEPFVDYWARDTNQERWQQRTSATMDQIQGFYDHMLARAEDAIALLDTYPMDRMPPEAERLFKLLLALAQAAIAVEMHGQPRARGARHRDDLRVSQGPWPFGGGLGSQPPQKTIRIAEQRS